MWSGARPSIALASWPVATTVPWRRSIEMIEGSASATPRPRTNTRMLAVPRSMPMSLTKRRGRRTCIRNDLRRESGDGEKQAARRIGRFEAQGFRRRVVTPGVGPRTFDVNGCRRLDFVVIGGVGSWRTGGAEAWPREKGGGDEVHVVQPD